MLADPGLVEPQRLNKDIACAHFVLREAGIDTGLVDLVHPLSYAPHGDDLAEVALTLPFDKTTALLADSAGATPTVGLSRSRPCANSPLTQS